MFATMDFCDMSGWQPNWCNRLWRRCPHALVFPPKGATPQTSICQVGLTSEELPAQIKKKDTSEISRRCQKNRFVLMRDEASSTPQVCRYQKLLTHKGSSLLVPWNGWVQTKSPPRTYETSSRGVPQRAQLYFKGFTLKADKGSTKNPLQGFIQNPDNKALPESCRLSYGSS